MLYKKLIIHTDGGSRGNPGEAAVGVVIDDDRGTRLFSLGKKIGIATNNVAEYRAVIEALLAAEKFGSVELNFFLDSELVVKQLNGEYKVRHPDLAQLFIKIHNLRQTFPKVTFQHVYREKNRDADHLLNLALDGKL